MCESFSFGSDDGDACRCTILLQTETYRTFWIDRHHLSVDLQGTERIKSLVLTLAVARS